MEGVEQITVMQSSTPTRRWPQNLLRSADIYYKLHKHRIYCSTFLWYFSYCVHPPILFDTVFFSKVPFYQIPPTTLLIISGALVKEPVHFNPFINALHQAFPWKEKANHHRD